MQIDKKIELARRHARMIVNAENWRGRTNGRTEARPNSRLESAYAILDVCDEVERLRGELEEQRTRRIRQVFEHR